MTWIPVCRWADLVPDRGVTALVDGAAVAVFRLTGGEVCAIAARDPFCGANVLSRGLVGSAGDVCYVASPMYKQRFDLATGACLDDPAIAVPVYCTRVVNGTVEVFAHRPEVPELAPKLNVTFTPGCAASNCLPIVVKASCSDAAANTVMEPDNL